MSSRMYSLEAHIVTLEKSDTNPPEQVGRIYFNTTENRPEVCIEQ